MRGHRGTPLSHAFSTTWTGLQDILLSETSEMGKDKNHMISLICETIQQKSNKQTNKTNKRSHTCRKQNRGYQKERGVGRGEMGKGVKYTVTEGS